MSWNEWIGRSAFQAVLALGGIALVGAGSLAFAQQTRMPASKRTAVSRGARGKSRYFLCRGTCT